jgi:hypothetical protein
MKQGPRLLKEELERQRKNKLCFECRKEGHKALFYCQGQRNQTWKSQGCLLRKQLYLAMQISATNEEA